MLLRFIADRITHIMFRFAQHEIKVESAFDQDILFNLASHSPTHTTESLDFRTHNKMSLVEHALASIPHQAIVSNLDSCTWSSRWECKVLGKPCPWKLLEQAQNDVDIE